MFRLSGKQDETIEWDNVLSLLEDDDQLAAIEKKFPATERNSFLDSLRHLNPDLADRLRGAGRQLNSAPRNSLTGPRSPLRECSTAGKPVLLRLS